MMSKLVGFDLELFSKTLDNGLLINVVPNKNLNNIYVTLSTKYGSIHDEFIPIDGIDYYKVPMGVAHFLEHKVFEQEDGIDPFVIFSENGADANANTSNYKTTYLFSGPTNLKENVNLLLDFVQSPYFTDENVEKEKGIIAQELKMISDRPFWKLYNHSLSNSFIKHPIKYPVGGTLNTIKKITKEDLYTCYNTFYHPSNMFITISGNVDYKEVFDIIEKNQKRKEFAEFKEIKVKEYKEPDNVKKEFEIIKSDVDLTKVSVNYKINKLDYDINRLKIYLNLYFSLIVGSTSLLDEKLRDNNTLTNGFGFDLINTDDHVLALIDFETENYEEVLKELDDIVGKVLIDEKDLERKKKTLISSCIYRSDNIYSINSKIDNNIINYGEVILNEFGLINSLNIDEMNEILSTISFNNKSVVILKSK